MGEAKQFFVLDIGTRSVIGLIVHLIEGKYHCIDYCVKEHEDRAMMDGQIHNIQSVSDTVISIKEYFESNHGPLQKVFIAAAGRSLRTERILTSRNIKDDPPLTDDSILHLEWLALQEAQSMISNQFHSSNNHTEYSFVGYSPLYYFIDEQPIGSLLYQQGTVASVEIIATFLPKIVITSLEATLQRAELVIDGLTLEPIACVHTLIPPTLRHLNIAVVDIGAGTSDIAITNEGTIIAYGMVPQAGDEITEIIQQLTLSDFQEAERMKRQLNAEHSSYTIETLNSNQQLVAKEDLLKRLFPFIRKLAHAITKKIKQLNNGQSPIALLLIGGGSLTPGLQQEIGSQLNLPPQQLIVKTLSSLKPFSYPKEMAQHPMFVTPFAIAFAAIESPLRIFSITINGQTERLLQMAKLTVKEALLSAGYLTRHWYGINGEPKIITLNQQSLTILGSSGGPPYIYLNGKKAKLSDALKPDDQITIMRGMSGEAAEIRVSDCVEEAEEKSVYIHDAKYTIMPTIKVNQITTSSQQLLENGDHIEYYMPTTITEIFQSLDLAHMLTEACPFHLTINGKQTIIPPHSGSVLCNGKVISLNSVINHLDRIEVIDHTPLTIQDLIKYKGLLSQKTITVTMNKNWVKPSKDILYFRRGKELLQQDSLLHSGDTLEIVQQEEVKFYFHDAVKFAKIEIPYRSTFQYTLLKNGAKSSLTEEIHDGDNLEIRWSTKTFQQRKKIVESSGQTLDLK